MTETTMPGAAPEVPSGPQPWTPSDALSFSWNLVKRKPEAVAILFVGGLCSSALIMPGAFINGILSASGDRNAEMIGALVYVGFVVLNIPVQIFFTMGMTRYAVNTSRGDPSGFQDIFRSGPFGSFFAASLLAGLGILGGTILCVVPGIILALGWTFWSQFVVDKGRFAADALGESWRLTKGHRANLFLFMLLMFAVNLLGLLCCCVGVFVTSAMTSLATAWIYLRLTGQRTAAVAA
jgi:uncharacterized membrane protein